MRCNLEWISHYRIVLFNYSVNEILADSDSDLEDMEVDKPAQHRKTKKQSQTWIEEDVDNIVDFKDPSISSKITGILLI